jgi:hypothetical protein
LTLANKIVQFQVKHIACKSSLVCVWWPKSRDHTTILTREMSFKLVVTNRYVSPFPPSSSLPVSSFPPFHVKLLFVFIHLVLSVARHRPNSSNSSVALDWSLDFCFERNQKSVFPPRLDFPLPLSLSLSLSSFDACCSSAFSLTCDLVFARTRSLSMLDARIVSKTAHSLCFVCHKAPLARSPHSLISSPGPDPHNRFKTSAFPFRRFFLSPVNYSLIMIALADHVVIWVGTC